MTSIDDIGSSAILIKIHRLRWDLDMPFKAKKYGFLYCVLWKIVLDPALLPKIILEDVQI